MKIRFVRHGRPDFDTSMQIQRSGICAALKLYDDAGVSEPCSTQNHWTSASKSTVVTSDLQRAIDSAHLMGVEISEQSSLLREARLPHPNMLPWSMSWKTAIAICRVAWLFGYSRNADGINHDRARARRAAKWLSVLAEEQDEMVVIGHGIMNRMIIEQLVSSGWSRTESSHNGYWSYQVISLAAD
jgi:broad specificity phosphatase PhoE